MKFNDDQPRISPLNNYKAPVLPTLYDVRKNPSILRNLPSRWQNKATIISSLGFLGALALMGCSHSYESEIQSEPSLPPFYDLYEQELAVRDAYIQIGQEALRLRSHHGGGGSMPFYVVHLTEQEAQSIIRAQLEAAGLRFDATPPNYTVDFWAVSIGLHLFDEEKGVAIAHISWKDNHFPFFSRGGNRLAKETATGFAQQTDDISIGVFFNPGRNFGSEGRREWEDMVWQIEWIKSQISELELMLESEEFDREYDLHEELKLELEEYKMELEWVEQELERIEREFEELDINEPPTPEQKAVAREVLIEQLTAQVQEFLDMLRSQGIV